MSSEPIKSTYTADDYNTDRHINAKEAIERLKEGNRRYTETVEHTRDLSPERIEELFEHGQHPYATIITCADSRVVPEHIFMAGLGELFVIRVAGNVIGPMEAASAVYACEHLHTRLLLVLGHTHCGAIKAALEGASDTVASITDQIASAIGDEQDPYRASVLNAKAAMDALLESPEIRKLVGSGDLIVAGAIYHTHSGKVEFLDEA